MIAAGLLIALCILIACSLASDLVKEKWRERFLGTLFVFLVFALVYWLSITQ